MAYIFENLLLRLSRMECQKAWFWSQIDLDSGEGNGTPLQYSCLENPMDGGAWWAAVHGVAKSLTWLSDFTLTFYFHVLVKEMATHSSVLAWRIPGTGEPGGLPSTGSHMVGHDWSNLAAAAAAADLERNPSSAHVTLGNLLSLNVFTCKIKILGHLYQDTV